MLNKVGMSDNRIGLMIIIETLFTTLIATSIGLLLCVLAVSLSSKSGININFLFDNNSGYGFGTVVYPMIDKIDFVHIFVLVSAIGILQPFHLLKRF